MANINDGGPAFPRPASEDTSGGTLADGNYVERGQSGMSLRDYFAGQAMQVIFTEFFTDEARPVKEQKGSFGGYSSVADCAYRMADTMLARRAKDGAA